LLHNTGSFPLGRTGAAGLSGFSVPQQELARRRGAIPAPRNRVFSAAGREFPGASREIDENPAPAASPHHALFQMQELHIIAAIFGSGLRRAEPDRPASGVAAC
jgi:hypothetical protein